MGLDIELFDFIHSGMKNAFFDWLMPIVREKKVWIPLYVFIVIFSFTNMSWKSASKLLIGLVLCVMIADMISSQIVKKKVQRLRPCQETLLSYDVAPLVTCGSGYSFPSSHAANHFAIAFFLFFSRKLSSSWIKVVFLIWAGIISYAQIYVGLHYPLDILAGALLGLLSARVAVLLFRLL